jgi:hypothetical protein
MILLPVGFFLTRKAMQDSQLFNRDYYLKIFHPVLRLFGKKTAAPAKTAAAEKRPPETADEPGPDAGEPDGGLPPPKF